MPRSKPAEPPALQIAKRLREHMRSDPDFGPDDVPTETPGVSEPGAIFHLNDRHGGRYRIRVNRV